MALANISFSDLYSTMMTRVNQLVTLMNKQTEGNATSSGTLTLTNPSLFNGGVTLNVANGMIQGDGGLISNVNGSSLSSIPNSALQNSSVSLVSNSSSITLSSSTATLGGGNVYIDATASSDETNTSATVLASAKSVSNVNTKTVAAFNKANTNASTISGYYITTVAAYAQSNTNATNITTLDGKATSAFAQANTNATDITTVSSLASTAFARGNTALSVAASAYAQGNTSVTNITNLDTKSTAAFSRANSNLITISSAYAKVNTAALFYTGSTSTLSDYPIGSIVLATADLTYTILNANITVYRSGGTSFSVIPFSGTALTGTWAIRSAPYTIDGGTTYVQLVQRIS